MCDVPPAMDRFVSRENVKRYRRLAGEQADGRMRILHWPAEEEAKFKSKSKLELSRSDGARERQSPVNAANEDRLENDGEQQQAGG